MCRDKQIETKHRIEEIEKLTNCCVRTERHLEQHSDIASKEQIEDAKELQQERKDLINNLEDKIVYGENNHQNQVKNLQENYEKTEKYIAYNTDHMSSDDLNNLKQKQENRQNQMNCLK